MALGKTSTDDNVILKFLELDLVNINVSAKFYQNIPNGLRVKFHCFQNLNLFQNLELGKVSTDEKCQKPMKNVNSQSLGLDLININVYAKVYQNIPHSSRDRVIFTFSEFEPS